VTSPVRVHLGSDHAGLELKATLVDWLAANGYEPVDHGPVEYDGEDDYPPYVLAAASAVAGEPGAFGIVIGGSGNGEAIAANKVLDIRAAVVWTETTARLAREHNDANVISLGARQYDADEALSFVATFLRTPFSGEQRHLRRLGQLSAYERSGVFPEPAV
jgi:ribose 5-phosphate isomerase B